eukprot:gene26246-32166_t
MVIYVAFAGGQELLVDLMHSPGALSKASEAQRWGGAEDAEGSTGFDQAVKGDDVNVAFEMAVEELVGAHGLCIEEVVDALMLAHGDAAKASTICQAADLFQVGVQAAFSWLELHGWALAAAAETVYQK